VNAADGKELRSWKFPGHVGSVEYSRDGRYLFTHNGNGTKNVLRLNQFAPIPKGAPDQPRSGRAAARQHYQDSRSARRSS